MDAPTTTDERDDLDGCDIEITDPDDDETAELRALFPNGVDDVEQAAQWKELFGGS